MDEYGLGPPKFDEDNFNLWKGRMILFLGAAGLYDYHVIKKGSHSHFLDVKAMNIIVGSLPDNVYQSVIFCSTAKDMWDTLCLIYEGTKNVKQMKKDELNRQYELFSAKKGESVTDTYNRFNRLLSDLRAVGIEKEKVALVNKFVDALPRHWEKLITSLRMNDSMPALYGTLLFHEQFNEQLEAQKRNEAYGAFLEFENE